MTIEEGISRFESFANLCEKNGMHEWQKEHEQYVAWLRELQERRKAPEIVRCKDCRYLKMDCQEPYCRIWHDYTSTNGYCHHGKRAERRTDENNNLYV